MPRWPAFAGIATLVAVLFLGLARLSQTYVRDPPSALPPAPGDAGADRATAPRDEHPGDGEREFAGDPARPADGPSRSEALAGTVGDGPPPDATGSPRTDRRPESRPAVRRDPGSLEDLPYHVLLANVVLSQAIFGVVLAFGAWYARIPLEALGLSKLSPSVVGVGAALGTGLYLANEAGSTVADRVGIGHDERLRDLLAPDSPAGWVALLGVVLPVVAGFEELLFRAALVGAIPAGFGVSPWAMAVVSSVAFGVGHGAQGRAGVVVTTVLGFALAAAFVLTGSFVVVAVAHYLVNALEFLVHEGTGVG